MDALKHFGISWPPSRWMIVALILFMPACSTVTTVSEYCLIAKPILLEKGEAAKLSDQTAREILIHNETWAKLCKTPLAARDPQALRIPYAQLIDDYRMVGGPVSLCVQQRPLAARGDF